MKYFLFFCIFLQQSQNFYTPPDTTNYESYVLALSWGGTTCHFNNCNQYGRNDVFNIHGLWPNSTQQNVQFCSKVSFFENEINKDLKNVLYQYWNSFYSDNWRFIFHEVSKHGSCWDFRQGDINQMPIQIQNILKNYNPRNQDSVLNTYIQITITLSQIINPYVTLLENGIIPGNEYFIGEIMNIMSDKYGWDSVIPVCKEDKRFKQMFLSELRFCLDLNFEHTKCNERQVSQGIQRCKKYNKILYPLFPDNASENQLQFFLFYNKLFYRQLFNNKIKYQIIQ